MGFKLRRLWRNVPKIALAAAAVYFAAPYAASIASGVKTVSGVAGPILQGRAMMSGGGGGTAPPQSFDGQPIIIGDAMLPPGLNALYIGGGFPDMSGGGAISQMYPASFGGGGNGFAAPASSGSGISPGLMIGLAAGGFGLVILMAILRR